MRRCDETITVYNARYDTEKDCDVYYGTVINGVSWYCEISSTVNDNGLKTADKFIIRIPADADFGGKKYVDRIAYVDSDTDACFTLKAGDIIVHGDHLIDNPRPRELQEQYVDCITILGVTDSTKAHRAPHWKVVGA